MVKSKNQVNWANPKEKISKYFTVGEALWLPRIKSYHIPTEEEKQNILDIAEKLDVIRELWGKPMTVSSWIRPESYNRSIGGAGKSAHIDGRAVDIRDPDGLLDAFCEGLDMGGKLKELGLWVEHKDATAGWTHFDTKNRGNRKSNIFKP